MSMINEEHIPEYIAAAQNAGLSPTQAEDLQNYVETSTKIDIEADIRLQLVSRILNQAATLNTGISEHIDEFKGILDTGLPEDLYVFYYATRLGLSISQSGKMISKVSDACHKNIIYTLGTFNEALKSLYPSDVDPELVVKAFEVFSDPKRWFADQYLNVLADIFTYSCPHRTPLNSILKKIANHNGKDELSNKILNDGIVLGDEVCDSFIEINTPLEYAPQPYKKKASFSQGLSELQHLSCTTGKLVDDIGEGMWVFDPYSKMWYSLGGKTEMTEKSVRHRFVPYDIFNLSDEPVLVHVHPAYFEMFNEIPTIHIHNPTLEDVVRKVYSSTPSGADYSTISGMMKMASRPVKAHAYIKNSLGVTEVIFPQDPDALEEMGQKSFQLREKALDALYAGGLLGSSSSYGNSVSNLEVVQKFIEIQNGLYPPGFKLILHPAGTDMDSSLKTRLQFLSI